jgi:hypothetical protein
VHALVVVGDEHPAGEELGVGDDVGDRGDGVCSLVAEEPTGERPGDQRAHLQHTEAFEGTTRGDGRCGGHSGSFEVGG